MTTTRDEPFDAFDVLLQDAVATAAPAQQRRSRTTWLRAAIALFSVSVVVAVLSLRAPTGPVAAIEPAQDPQPFRPKTAAGLRAFVEAAVSFRFEISTLAAVSRDRKSILSDVDEAATVVVDGRQQVERWRGLLATAFDETKSYDQIGDMMSMAVLGPDGRLVKGSLSLGEQPRLDFATAPGGEALGPFVLAGDLLRECVATRRRIDERRFELDGKVANDAELATLPDTQQRLCLPVAPAPALADRLRRFTALATLVLVPQADGGGEPPDGATLRAVRELPVGSTIRTLALSGEALTDPVVAALADWPALQVLELQGGPVPLQGLRSLTRLTTLRLRGCRAQGGLQLPIGITGLMIESRELPGAIDVAAAVRSLPALRELTLLGRGIDDATVRSLPQSRLHSLRLIRTACTADGLAILAELPTLRSLTVLGTDPGGSVIEGLSTLRQLSGLEIWDLEMPTDWSEALRTALPGCRVAGRPDMAPIVPGSIFRRLVGAEF